jgi:hypothetical protein
MFLYDKVFLRKIITQVVVFWVMTPCSDVEAAWPFKMLASLPRRQINIIKNKKSHKNYV